MRKHWINACPILDKYQNRKNAQVWGKPAKLVQLLGIQPSDLRSKPANTKGRGLMKGGLAHHES